MRIASTRTPSEQHKFTLITNPLLSIVLSVLLTIALKLLVEKTWPYLGGLWQVWWFTTIATLVVSLSGGGLFLFRRYFQAMYGLSEIGFAMVVIWTSITKAQTAGDAPPRIAVVGGAYLIVRGLTNYDEGKKKRPLKNL